MKPKSTSTNTNLNGSGSAASGSHPPLLRAAVAPAQAVRNSKEKIALNISKYKLAAAAAAAKAASIAPSDGVSPAPSKKPRTYAAVASSVKTSAAESKKPEGDAVMREELTAAAVDAANLARKLKELKEFSRHFSKIATRFAFEDNTAAYQAWAIQFEAELINSDLDSILSSDPSAIDAADQMVDPALFVQQQKEVYHMIFQCMPKAKMTVLNTLPAEQRTGYGAWVALRQFYIGDEQAYLASLESKFQHVSWEGADSFPTFETKFDSLLSELQNAGAGKAEHVKKAVLMSAIEDSPHKDAQGNSVFVRLNTVSKIFMEKPYRDWLTALRIEAQQIQDSNQKRGTKRAREERKEPTVEVSFVASSSPSNSHRQVSLHGRPASSSGGAHKPLCRNMQYTGRCSFGKSCRFSHDIPPSLLGKGEQRDSRNRQQSGAAAASAGDSKSSRACWDFQKGKCHRGDKCRFSHTAAPAGDSSSSAAKMQTQQFEIMQTTIVENSRSHRVVIDSGASYHFTPRRELLRNIRPLLTPVPIKAAFGQPTMATECGDGFIQFGEDVLEVGEMILCESLSDTLLSYVLLLKHGHKVTVDELAAGGALLSEDSSFSLRISMCGNILSLHSVVPTIAAEINVATRGAWKQQ